MGGRPFLHTLGASPVIVTPSFHASSARIQYKPVAMSSKSKSPTSACAGEHAMMSSGGTGVPGSSPRARETQDHMPGRRDPHRFIPACAGNTLRPRARPRWRTVHPRVRGEHAPVAFARVASTGSSPRARGTQLAVDLKLSVTRFIPACAGNTCARTATGGRRAVHPRVRGEHSIAVPRTSPGCGSSPRARGTGEHRSASPGASSRVGSSPRARGTPYPDGRIDAFLRFIPACAGNTSDSVVI